MTKIIANNTIALLKNKTQQKLIALANKVKMSPDVLLNTLIDDEIERQRLLDVPNNLPPREIQAVVASQKIAKLCNEHLSMLDSVSESIEINEAIENLYNDLLKVNLLSVNARKDHIVESNRIKINRTDYYWYASVLAKNISMWFGTINVYLFHEMFHPISEVVFIGMPNNVVVCTQVYAHLYKLFKKIKLEYQKDAGEWGSNREMSEDANRYAYEFSHELKYAQAFIDNDNDGEPLYNYALEKYKWALR